MSTISTIEWTDATWNPVTGCTKISRGCDNCYAETFSERFRGVEGHHFNSGFDLTLRAERLEQPLKWKLPKIIFVNSMSDLFHKDIPTEFIDSVFDTMEKAHWHIFQLLTKRSSLMKKYINNRYASNPCPNNIWIGVSVEDSPAKSRIKHLQDANISTRFLSIEPLIADVGELQLNDINWVIVGGESGNQARPMNPKWAIGVRDQCMASGVAFFFKQWGRFGQDGIARSKKANGRELFGEVYDGMPI
ncbi:MAG: phage Gp37/Gp68 family protein [Sphingorhabdus sp.]